MLNDINLEKNYIGKVNKTFKIVLLVITLLEMFLLIRGLIIFNFERLKHRLYFYSYAFLFISSLITLIVFWVCRKNEKHSNEMVVMLYIYAFCVIMWSTVVTCIDCYANGDSGIIVYVITCMAVGVLTLIKPWVFLLYLGVSGAFLLVFTAYLRGWELYSEGFYINYVVFLVTAGFVNIHNYQLSRREYEARLTLNRLSYTDQLTGVYNRRGLDQKVLECTENNIKFVFVLLDIDCFKEVNDTYGHPVGDVCLITLANLLNEFFGDQVYRFGGDEFAIISFKNEYEVCKGIDELNTKLDKSVEEISLHISAGIYSVKEKDLAKDVFINADKALYCAKKDLKLGWVIYNEDNI